MNSSTESVFWSMPDPTWEGTKINIHSKIQTWKHLSNFTNLINYIYIYRESVLFVCVCVCVCVCVLCVCVYI
jgi:hypothetical protein